MPVSPLKNEKGISELRQLSGGKLPSVPDGLTFHPPDPLLLARSIFPVLVSLLTEPEHVHALLKDHLYEDGFWRDFVAFTHTLRTFHGHEAISPVLSKLVKRARPVRESFQLIESAVQLVPRLPNGGAYVSIMVSFNISHPQPARCTALAKILPPGVGGITSESVTGKLWVLSTYFEHFISYQPLDLATLSEIPPAPPPDLPTFTDVLIIGASQSGLSLSARLQALGIDHIAVDSEPTVGDSWRKRYKACKLHTSPAFSGLPFVDFPADCPIQIPAGMMADSYQGYVRRFALPIYPGRSVQNATWNGKDDSWDVVLETEHGTSRISAKHIVFAIGVSGRLPFIPHIPNRSAFRGTALHSVEYCDGSAWQGKRALIIGAATTAMDMACDLVDHGADDVWMVQRSPTRVLPLEDIHVMQAGLWDGKTPTEIADMIANSDPIAIQGQMSAVYLQSRQARTVAMFEQLRKTKFKFKDEGSHLEHVYVIGGGHYLDVGGIQKIIDGEIKVKSDAAIESFTESGLKFVDGQTIDADVIVYATGFEESWRAPIASILGDSLADQIQTDVFGVNPEGEIRGFWKPSGHPRVWLMGGDTLLTRYYSKFLAAQILASLKGIKLEPYTE